VHNNFYFLRQLSRALKEKLAGFTVVSCFTQQKEELVLEFNNSTKSFFVRAHLQSDFCCLSFPETFVRARKNSVDLFSTVILRKVESIRQYENERSFSIALEGNLHLLFKMHGNRSNIILFNDTTPVEIFRNHQKADWKLTRTGLDRTVDWSKDFFLAHQETLKKVYFTFGKIVWAYLNELGFEEADPDIRWALLQQALQFLDHPEFMICEKEGELFLSLVPFGKPRNTFSDPIHAIDAFYHAAAAGNTFFKEKKFALRQLKPLLESSRSYIAKSRQKLEEIRKDSSYKAWADLIMANLDQIKPGIEKITLNDFYRNQEPMELKLKKTLNAQQNAELYYRKSKNQQIEIQKLKESIAAKEKEIGILEIKIATVEKETDLKPLRKTVQDAVGFKTKKEKQAAPLPYHAVEYKGFKIWIGKNAESNDQLTLKYSFKDDLWLHAKDVAGSHVLIKYQSGKKFPKDVIERAAQLAAYHSKRKNESLCPVAFTLKKFVRKRKGDPAGAVVVEREEVILVEPMQYN